MLIGIQFLWVCIDLCFLSVIRTQSGEQIWFTAFLWLYVSHVSGRLYHWRPATRRNGLDIWHLSRDSPYSLAVGLAILTKWIFNWWRL